MEQEHINQSLSLIRKDLDLAPEAFGDHPPSYKDLLDQLTHIVEYLLNQDFNKLLNALYRIDVSEQKLKAALANDQAEPARLIAEMILERELQKVETRIRYRGQ